MKKSLIASTMTLGICSLLSAQVGINIGENVAPQVTLQVDGKPGDTGAQDGVLVPRITRVQLAAKDTVYSADQNGALIFITDVSGTSTPKTADITSTGFYYYNSSTSKWTAVTPPAQQARDYGNGSFTPNRVVVNVSMSIDWSSYSQYNYIELVNLEGSQNSTVIFPNASEFKDSTLYLYNNSGFVLTFNGETGFGLQYLSNSSALHLYSDGTRWYLLAGRA